MNITKDHVSITLSVSSLIVATIALLWGNNLIGRMEQRVGEIEQKADSLNQQLIYIAQNSPAPRTERIDPHNAQSSLQPISLTSMNITLADYPAQEKQVMNWLKNPNSGYPALAEALTQLLGNKRLKGNPVPLTLINAKNLAQHGRDTSQPFIDMRNIEQNKLEEAVYLSWQEKNSSSTLQSFNEIVE